MHTWLNPQTVLQFVLTIPGWPLQQSLVFNLHEGLSTGHQKSQRASAGAVSKCSFWNSSREKVALAWSDSNVGECVHAKFDEQSSRNLCPPAADATT